MRLVSYNILDGGEGRADPIAEVIEAQRPDLVAVVEADFMPTLERIASRLKFDFIHAQGNGHAVALLSRWPIAWSVNHAPLRPVSVKCLLEVQIDAPDRAWTIGVTHLHAHARESDEEQRLAEIDTLLTVFARHRSEGLPHLIVGDFNANHPEQVIDPERCKPRTREDWTANGNRLPRRAIGKMLGAGYVDTLHAVAGKEAMASGTFSTQYPGQRVDYIFAHSAGPGAIKRVWIEHDRLAKYASDHFPVGVEIE